MQYDFAHNLPFDLEHGLDLYVLFWQPSGDVL